MTRGLYVEPFGPVSSVISGFGFGNSLNNPPDPTNQESLIARGEDLFIALCLDRNPTCNSCRLPRSPRSEEPFNFSGFKTGSFAIDTTLVVLPTAGCVRKMLEESAVLHLLLSGDHSPANTVAPPTRGLASPQRP
jgi:hypothetical protein